MSESPIAASRFGITMDGVEIADDPFVFKATEAATAEAGNEGSGYVHTFTMEVKSPPDPGADGTTEHYFTIEIAEGTQPDSATHEYDFII